MAHTITLSDEEYERLTQAAQLFEQTPHEMVSRWIAWLPRHMQTNRAHCTATGTE